MASGIIPTLRNFEVSREPQEERATASSFTERKIISETTATPPIAAINPIDASAVIVVIVLVVTVVIIFYELS